MMIHIWPYIGFIAANTFSHYAYFRQISAQTTVRCSTYRSGVTPRYMNMSKMCGYYI